MPQSPVTLSDLERDVLWMASQGFRSEQIARQHTLAVGSVRNIYFRVASRLHARNLTHAVARGLITGVIGPYRDCGERFAYLRHLRRNETPCVACRLSNAVYVAAQTSAPLPEDAGLTATQLKVLRCIAEHDCSQVEAAARLGMDRRRIASHMSQVYQRLGVFHMRRTDRTHEAVKVARNRGYLD